MSARARATLAAARGAGGCIVRRACRRARRPPRARDNDGNGVGCSSTGRAARAGSTLRHHCHVTRFPASVRGAGAGRINKSRRERLPERGRARRFAPDHEQVERHCASERPHGGNSADAVDRSVAVPGGFRNH